MLLIEGEAGDGADWIVGVSPGDDQLELVGELYRYTPAIIRPNEWSEVTPTPAHDGFGVFAVVEMRDDSPVLVKRHVSRDDGVLSLPLGSRRPVALHLVRRALFLGSYGEVGWMDLGREDVSYERLVHRADMAHKPYDFFARDGNRLLAIDDIVMPIMADLFALDDTGKPTHVIGGELPVFVYGSYQVVVLTPDNAGERVLYAVSSFGGQEGWGQVLFSIRVSDSVLSRDMVSLEEVAEAGEFEPGGPSLIAGDKYTPFTGLALHRPEDGGGASVLVASGERGLLVVSERLASDPAPILVNFDGPCLDVRVLDGHAYVLLGGESPAVLRLRRDGGQWSPGAFLALEGAPRRFVR